MACQFCQLCAAGEPMKGDFHIPTRDNAILETRCRATRAFKAGDTVKHGPTGETWLLIRVVPGGWPATMAHASDCALVSPIEDAPDRLQRLMTKT
jgi:hypothetical protein